MPRGVATARRSNRDTALQATLKRPRTTQASVKKRLRERPATERPPAQRPSGQTPAVSPPTAKRAPQTPDSTGSAADFLPQQLTLPALAEAAAHCRGCDLYKHATQTVFGEGAPDARLVLVGEQPGDQEDLAGHPFVGPAGRVLQESLEAAGIDAARVYVTNAVKHFKFEPRGKRRIHSKPRAHEIAACRPWLEAELAAIRPKVVVCLGATAAQALMGSKFRLTQHRGEFFSTAWAPHTTATIHPSAVLRAPTSEDRAEKRRGLVADLKRVAQKLRARN